MATNKTGSGAAGRFRQVGVARPAVFVSYSHHDAVDRDHLLGVLKPLCRKYHDKPLIWVDREALKGGDRWEDEIREGLRAADVFIVLMSQKFLNSDFCMKEELPVILERQADDGALVLGIAVGPVDASDFVCPVGGGRRLSLQALDCLPKSSDGWWPVSAPQWGGAAHAWKAVRDQIERAVWPAEPSPDESPGHAAVLPVTRPRYSACSPQAEKAPFLCDRQDQIDTLWMHLGAWASRPLLIVTEGHRDDCPPDWVERIASHEFARARPEFADGAVQFPQPMALEWPKKTIDAEHGSKSWCMRLAAKLLGVASATPPMLHGAQMNKGPTFWFTTLTPQPAPTPQVRLADTRSAMLALEGLITLLEQWPDRSPQTVVVMAINLMVGDDTPVGEDSELGRKFAQRLRRADKAGRVHAVSVGRLPGIELDHLESWKTHPDVRPHLPTHELRGLTLPLKLHRPGTTVPMQRFADEYKTWVQDPEAALARALAASAGTGDSR